MNPKSHFTTILIFASFFLFCFSVQAQSNTDTISIEKRGANYVYYKDNAMLSLSQIMQLTNSNPEAFKLLAKANTLRNASYVFAIFGGGCIGYSLGYLVSRTWASNPFHPGIFISTLGVGAAFIGAGISCKVGAKKKAVEGIAVYNNAIRQSNSKSLDLGFSPSCIMLKLSF